MGLLELEHVSKCFRRGSRVALEDVSLVIEAGEMVVVWGERRSGRSTLLRVAAGIESPDAGVVRFEGRELSGVDGQIRDGGIAYCRRVFRASTGRSVLDHVVAAQLARKVPRPKAKRRAWEVLCRVGVERCATLSASELHGGESVRAAIARALSANPRIVIIDEPAIGVDVAERDSLLSLLRSLADEGIAVLASAGEGTGLLGADRVLSLGNGRLRGELVPELAPVADLSLHRRTSG